MDKLAIINDYVIANEKRLKNICFKLYKGNDLWKDLFQEFYLRIINTSVSLEKYPIEKLAYQCLFSVFRDRYKKHSALCMITAIEISDCVLNGGYEQNDMFDVWDFIEKELDKEHGFVPVTVFIESIERPLREINRETRIPLGSLHNYKEQGRKKILKFISQ